MALDLYLEATPPVKVQETQYGYVLLDANGHHAEHLTLGNRIKFYRKKERAEEACAEANKRLKEVDDERQESSGHPAE